MPTKRVKWTYEAELDYIIESMKKKGEWIIGFLNDEGNPYECPHTSDSELVNKLKELDTQGLSSKLRVTVEINEKLDKWGKQYPTLVEVETVKD